MRAGDDVGPAAAGLVAPIGRFSDRAGAVIEGRHKMHREADAMNGFDGGCTDRPAGPSFNYGMCEIVTSR